MADDVTPGYRSSDWAGDSAQRWARHADGLEAQLAPIADLLRDAAALRPGERVLDVGCGRGVTTRDAARAVGPTGLATGVDIARNLLDEAAAAAAADGIEQARWIEADAQRHDFGDARFDVIISRFGVMFFDDARAAFANLRAVAPGGRLAMVVWQTRDRSPIFEVPLTVGATAARELGVDIDANLLPCDGGPFAFGDEGNVRAILGDAGWQAIDVRPVTLPLYSGGPGTVDDALDVSFEVGPLRLALTEASDEQRAEVRARVAEAYAAAHDGTGVRLDGAVFVVTARA